MSRFKIENQLKKLKKGYENVKAGDRNIKSDVVANCMMSGIALFNLKHESLLQFEKSSIEPAKKHNLETLYHINQVVSDTYFREVLDEVDPKDVRPGFKMLFRELQEGKRLKEYAYYNGYYLLSVDGSGYFSSHTINCSNCCEKHHRNGKVTYHHNILGASIVHPEKKAVIPVCPEPIQKQDGDTKNDCEINAGVRLFENYRRDHPHLKTIVVQDALY